MRRSSAHAGTEKHLIVSFSCETTVLLSEGCRGAKEHRARASADAWSRDLASRTPAAVRCATMKTVCKKRVPFKKELVLQFADCSAQAPSSLRRMWLMMRSSCYALPPALAGCMRSALDRPRRPQALSSRIRSHSRPSCHFTVGVQHEVPRLLAET